MPDYSNLLKDRLQTAADLYVLMVGEFHESRAFVPELMSLSS